MRKLSLVWLRLGLGLVGVGFFAYSLRSGLDWARWVAIGCLAVAVTLRFVDRALSRSRSR
jgi:tellurite resistance protein TehA-like permease